jgi:serine/threonine protein kinase
MTTTGSLPPGAAVGSFTVEALIGRGGMGEVYRAVHRELGRPVH